MNERVTSLVTSNYGLVIFTARKYAVNYQDMDDLVQAGSVGLIKAATTYDQSRNISFATYAVTCIQNEVWQELKRKNKYQDDIPLDSPIRKQDDTRVHVEDTIADERQDFEKKGEIVEYLEMVLRHIMNTLNSRERYVLLCRAGGITQDELAEELQVSQSFTSRIEKNSIKKLKRFVNFNKEVTGPYHVVVKDSMVEITCTGTEEQMNEVMRKIDFRETVPKFTINYDGEKLKLKVPGDPESMPFVAKILNVIEN